ncbi:LexA repressor [Grimontia marina]|uniref:LexA repressor n=2 Tax=Grimontia marina TaxID=646534 RepID=A0A128F094_9GAMM|nr:LexA repressor [Grimontia marina]
MQIGERVKLRRLELGLSQEDLAKAILKQVDSRFNRVTLSNIEMGIQGSVKDKILLALTKSLKCNAEWLVYGTEPKELALTQLLSRSEPGPAVEQKCPFISWDEALSFTVNNDYPDSAYTYSACPVPCGPRTFILTVNDESMGDRFAEGDWIYVDPDQQESAKDKFVIVQLSPDSEAIFKQLVLIDNQVFLKALNPDLPSSLRYTQPTKYLTIKGTVVAHVKPV